MKTNLRCETTNIETHISAFRKEMQQSMRNKASLSELLNQFMQERGMSPSQTYNSACLQRGVFLKMVSFHSPKRGSKRTLLCTAVALNLDLHQTELLLETCGYCFEPLSIEDGIFKYAITHNLDMVSVYAMAEAEGLDFENRGKLVL